MTPPPSSADDIEQRWSDLPTPDGPLFEAERVMNWAGGRVLIALDLENQRHLLIEITEHPSLVPRPKPLQGLAVHARTMRVHGEDGNWMDVVLLEQRGERAFVSLAIEIMNTLSTARSAEARTVLDVINRWRRFWAAIKEGLSPESRLGLFGELWLLLEWVPDFTVTSIEAWRGPLKGRHDFVTPALSVEVKVASNATGPVRHKIASLAQLDEPGSGRLFLLSIRAVADPLGGYTLDGLVERARLRATELGGDAADELDERLAGYGWSPVDQGKNSDPYRIAGQQLFEVTGDFPRLTTASFANGLPPEVQDVTYQLDTSGCSTWLISKTPDSSGPLATLR